MSRFAANSREKPLGDETHCQYRCLEVEYNQMKKIRRLDGKDMSNQERGSLVSRSTSSDVECVRMTGGVQVMWDDVFGEPEGVRSADWAWRCSYKCFKSTRFLPYLFLFRLSLLQKMF